MIPYLHICTYFGSKKHFFTTYFLQLIILIWCKIILSVRNNFTNDEHVFLKILVTNLHVLCFDIYAIPTMCTLYYQSRLNLVSEIYLVNILTFFSMRCCRGSSLAPVWMYVCLCVFIHGDVVSREDLFVIQCYFCVLVTAWSTCLISHDFIHFSFDYMLHSLRLFA